MTKPTPIRYNIAARADPPLPLARLRARGQLTELRQNDLRFAPDQAARFIQQVTGLELEASAVAALTSRTEGWIAGLQMAAASLQNQSAERAANLVQTFSGSNRYVLDYLLEEVLHRQPPHVQTFLLQTSILDRLTAPLCSAVLTEIDAAQFPTPHSPLPTRTTRIIQPLYRPPGRRAALVSLPPALCGPVARAFAAPTAGPGAYPAPARQPVV